MSNPTTINIYTKDNKDVALKNENTGKEIIITFTNKKINAEDIYNLIDYKPTNEYILTETRPTSNASDPVIEFFDTVKDLIDKIIKRINNLSSAQEDAIA